MRFWMHHHHFQLFAVPLGLEQPAAETAYVNSTAKPDNDFVSLQLVSPYHLQFSPIEKKTEIRESSEGKISD